MKNFAFIFPGQGSQYVGMGKDLFENFDEAKKIYDIAENILQFPLKRICFEGPEEELKQTKITQPAIFVHSVVIDGFLKKQGFKPLAAAGHSLGEYSALVSAEAMSFADTLQLVKIRGEEMQKSGEQNPGTMAAIIGVDKDEIEKICKELSKDDIVQPANFNSPGQIVISGSHIGVEKAMELARSRGARLVKKLEVGGAFHSPLMADALDGLAEALNNVSIRSTSIPVYNNVEAKPLTEPEMIRESLRKQLLAPVQWENVMRNMIDDDFKKFLEVGPRNVLQGLLKRINRDVDCRTVGTSQEIDQLSN